ISSQLFADPRALALAATILLGLGFIPGFPTIVFVALSVMLALGAFLLHRRAIAAGGEPDAERAPRLARGAQEASEMPGKGSRYRVTTRVGQDLAGVVPLAQFRLLADRSRHDLYHDLGVDPPAVELRVDQSLEPHAFRIDLEGVPVADGEIPAAHI